MFNEDPAESISNFSTEFRNATTPSQKEDIMYKATLKWSQNFARITANYMTAVEDKDWAKATLIAQGLITALESMSKATSAMFIKEHLTGI